jgi:predicted secreted Zn-dependent protease
MTYELAKRSHDGLVVRLVWDPLGDQVIVRHRDRHTDEAFAAAVPNERALDAFHHRNAYRLACSPATA